MPFLLELPIKNVIGDMASRTSFYYGRQRIAAELKGGFFLIYRKQVCPLSFLDEKRGPGQFRTLNSRTKQEVRIHPVHD
jgi:hypothetical protein